MAETNLLDAIRVAKENEKISMEKYTQASQQISNQLGKKLFAELSEFEKYHYEQVSALEKSLMEKGNYIAYAGKDFPLPPLFEVKAAEEPNRKTAMEIITEAIEFEHQAEKTYAQLADQITDKQGHDMFIKLSKEEHKHGLILDEAYWTLTNLGIWKWTPSKHK